MDSKNDVHQGEVLMLLVKRSKMTNSNAAEMLGINKSHLSRVYNSQSISPKIKWAAVKVFDVDISVFENGLPDMPAPDPRTINEPLPRYQGKPLEIVEENKLVKKQLEAALIALDREQKVNDDLRKALLEALEMARKR